MSICFVYGNKFEPIIVLRKSIHNCKKVLYSDKKSLTVDVSMETTIFLNTKWVTEDESWKHCQM